MNTDLLKGLGIGGCTVLIIVILVILNFDKILLFFSTVLKPLSFIRIIRRKSYTLSVQSKVNDICKNLAPELFDKSLKIKWIKKDEINKVFSTSSSEEITIHIVDEKNPNKNVTSILQEYISTSFIPNLRLALDCSFVHVNEQHIISRIIQKSKNSALSVYYNDHVRKIVTDEEKELTKTLHTLDRGAYYFPCFVNSLSYVDESVDEYLLVGDKTKEEVCNFTRFLHDIAIKETGEETELTFTGHLFKVSVILVAKKETLNLSGLKPHVDRIHHVMAQGVDRIYLRGIGKENIINVKRLVNSLKRFEYLNKILEKKYTIADTSGKQHILLMVVYENYYYKRLEYEKQQNEEIIKLLSTYIPEIENGAIEVLKVARERNIMTKVLLKTNLDYIDVVACCIGSNFERRNSIESKLLGENIHFIKYSDDSKILIRNALFPLQDEWIKDIKIRSIDKFTIVIVNDDKIGLAIGKLGINVKLAQWLIGWKIEIRKSSEMKI